MGLIGEIFAMAGLHIDSASFAEYGSKLKATEGQISGFASASSGILAGAFAVPAVAVAGITGYGVMVASSMQDASASLTTVYGDLDTAKEKFTWLSDFAASTPFEFPELLDATVKLKGYGIEAQDYMGTVGDAASAMGKSLDQTTEAVADAMTGEFERLKEFGIKATVITKDNAVKLGASLADVGMTALNYTTKSGEEGVKVVDRANKEMVLSSIQSIWDVEKGFKGAMETRSKTMSGMWSTIKDNFSMGLADLVGFKDMEVQTLSLMSVLMGLAGIAVTVSGAFNGMGEPAQTFVLIAALGGSAALALSGGLMAASMAGITTTSVMTALSLAVNSVIWPAVAIVAGLALLGAGLVYLEEKTGLVSAAWEVAKDVFTITVDYLSRAAGTLRDWIVLKIEEISEAIDGIIPDGALTKVEGFYNSITGWFGDAAEDIDKKATAIEKSNDEAASSFDQYSNVDMSGTGSGISTLDDFVKTLGTDTKAGTSELQEMGTVPMAGTQSSISLTNSLMQGANQTAQNLNGVLTDAGQVSFNGTYSQVSLVDSKGKTTALTVQQLEAHLKTAGNTSQAGTVGQLALVDSKGKAVNITTAQASALLKTAGSQSMSGTISGINGITNAWGEANKAANAYAKAAIAQRQTEKTYEAAMKGSISTGQSKGGVTVVAAGQSIKSSNTVNNTYNSTYNQPTASDKGTKLKIIGRS